jgi:hypothetical protein
VSAIGQTGLVGCELLHYQKKSFYLTVISCLPTFPLFHCIAYWSTLPLMSQQFTCFDCELSPILTFILSFKIGNAFTLKLEAGEFGTLPKNALNNFSFSAFYLHVKVQENALVIV